MVDDARLRALLDAAQESERAIRVHLGTTGSAGERVKGQTAYRHVVALRRSLEEWVEARIFRAAHGG